MNEERVQSNPHNLVSGVVKKTFSSEMELLSPEGLRTDGRRPAELRNIKCKLGLFTKADGSCYFQQGNSKVLVAVYGPREVSMKSKADHSKAIINCEYTMASFSTGERKKPTKGTRRAMEVSLVIRQTFENVILTHLFPHSQIDIFVQVLQADGGIRCASVNAATLALINAGIPMKDFVCSCATGIVNGVPILDLNYVEESSGGTDVTVAVLPHSNEIVLLQMDSRLPVEMFEKVLQLAVEGCKTIHNLLVKEVDSHTSKLILSRGIF